MNGFVSVVYTYNFQVKNNFFYILYEATNLKTVGMHGQKPKSRARWFQNHVKSSMLIFHYEAFLKYKFDQNFEF